MPSRPDARAAQPADGDLWEAVAPVGGGVSEARNDADLWEASNGARSESEPKASGFARPEARGRRPSADTASQPRCIGRKPDNSGNEPAAERLRSEAFPHGASQGSRLRKGVDVISVGCFVHDVHLVFLIHMPSSGHVSNVFLLIPSSGGSRSYLLDCVRGARPR